MRKIESDSPSFTKPARLKITVCPTCGSDKIKLVRKDQTREFEGRVYTVPDLEFYECPDCGEEVYSPEAVRKIQAHSPAYKKATRKKKAA
ncbi:MAG: YgiT-type zinc finger protein [Blastocatellia bacterium]